MVVVLSLADDVEFCPSKVFHTPVTPHATNLLLSEITVGQGGIQIGRERRYNVLLPEGTERNIHT